MRHIAAAFLLASACSTTRPEPIRPTPADPEHCGAFQGVYDYLYVEPGPARQGATLRIAARQRRGPADQLTPPDCISDWTVSDPKLATLSDDRSTVRIADDATPGATIIVSYRIKGQSVAARLPIVARDAVVLTGLRRQSAVEGCEAPVPVGELEFAENRFAVTFLPFETYKDYWGSYQFDAATGALSLTVDGGNYSPPNLDLEGKARFDAAGKLVLEGMFLGQPSGAPAGGGTCRYTFG
jgi:hypothetical protein